jgi:DNA adenine methylase
MMRIASATAGNAADGRVRPPLKWAGGKYRVLGEILPRLPAGARLIEPFVGSGAVFLNTDYPRYLLNDANPDLVAFYRALKQEGGHFIERAQKLFNERNNSPDRYYALRAEFNSCADPGRKSAIFLYLNRHSYNGLCRYNASGGFNVPFGRHARPYFPRRELELCAGKLRHVRIENRDFEPVMREARAGDVIYCDPPYIPLSETSNFTSYSARVFGREEQERLARAAEELAGRGVPVLVSNHATEFTRRIYAPAKRHVFSVRRLISCNGQRRLKTDEVLALFS